MNVPAAVQLKQPPLKTTPMHFSLRCASLRKLTLSGLIASTVLVLPLPLSACSYYVGLAVFFGVNSAVVSAHYLDKISDWVARTKADLPPPQLLEIHVSVDRTEIDPQALGRKRELALRLALIEMGMYSSKVYTPARIQELPAGAYSRYSHYNSDVKRGDIVYRPPDGYWPKECLKPIETIPVDAASAAPGA